LPYLPLVFSLQVPLTGITEDTTRFPVLSNSSHSFYWPSAKYMAVSLTFIRKDKWILFRCCDESAWTRAHCSAPSHHMFQQLLGCLFFKCLVPANTI